MALAATVTPNDPAVAEYPRPFQTIHAAEAQAMATCDGVSVAVIDTGVSPIEDLKDALLPGINTFDGGATTDTVGHGTAVASVIAATVNNGIGTAGICSKAHILPIKAAGPDGLLNILAIENGMAWATAHGARVINISAGGIVVSPVVAQTMANAINAAAAAGVVVVLAAGNDGKSDPNANNLASNGLDKPNPNAIIVGGLDADFAKLASESDYGKWVDIAAPLFIETDKLDGNGYGISGGTSFAAPQVAAAAAMLLGLRPQLTPAQVKQFIVQGGTPWKDMPVACGCVLNLQGAIQAATGVPITSTTGPTTTNPQSFHVKLKITGHGMVSGTNGIQVYSWSKTGVKTFSAGNSLTLTAMPAKGWKLRWNGLCKGSTKARCLSTLSGNVSASVAFTRIKTKKK
jgi:subtilisin family serine protease